jgi:hypothetical protein
METLHGTNSKGEHNHTSEPIIIYCLSLKSHLSSPKHKKSFQCVMMHSSYWQKMIVNGDLDYHHDSAQVSNLSQKSHAMMLQIVACLQSHNGFCFLLEIYNVSIYRYIT